MTQELKKTAPTVASKTESNRAARQITPRVDICESNQEVTLFAQLPGVLPENIQLNFEKGELTLLGKAEPPQGSGKVILDETRAGDYYRVFSIHDTLDSQKIHADYKHGVLVIHLPKAEAAKPREIKVQIA